MTVAYTPDAGPAGTHVVVSGSGFTGSVRSTALSGSYTFSLLIDLPGCELIAYNTNAHVQIDASGNLSGSFTVPVSGSCFQGNGTLQPLPPGEYRVVLGVHVGDIGTFLLTDS